ncbi:MAG: hypothetical protein NWQ19_07845 [Nonlabens sp.]|nr:hypothetical protein [Nonlabens sp.]
MTPKLYLTTLVLTLLLVSCNDKKEITAGKPVVEQETEAQFDEQTALKYLKTMRENVQTDSTKLLTIKDWPAHATLTNTVEELPNKPISKHAAIAITMREQLDDFKNTIPAYLQIDDIQDAIEDLEKATKIFETQLPKNHVNPKDKRQQVLNINLALDYVDSKILQTYQYYVAKPSPDVTTYLAELNDFNVHKTTAQGLRAADLEK